LIADFAAKLCLALPGDAGGEQSGSQAARLQDDDLPGAEQTVIEEHLWHLGGFAGTGRRRDEQPPVGLQPGEDLWFDFVNRKPFSHVFRVMSGEERFWASGT